MRLVIHFHISLSHLTFTFHFYISSSYEVGHSLGMLHSKDPTALMAPVYRGYMPDFDLCQDDIERIQALYGKPKPELEPKPVVEKEEKWIPEDSIESRISFWENMGN